MAEEGKELCPRWPSKQVALIPWRLLNPKGHSQGSDSESISYDVGKGIGARCWARRRENPTEWGGDGVGKGLLIPKSPGRSTRCRAVL